MREGRWYPTCLALPDGSALVLAGWRDHLPWKIVVPPFLLNNRSVERWNPMASAQARAEVPGRWEDLRAGHRMAYYPRVLVVPPGEVLKVGREPKTLVFDLTSLEWKHLATSGGGPRVNGTSVLLPLRPPGYEIGVLILGGAASEFLPGPATNSAEILRRNGEAYEWEWARPMTFPRLHVNATLLLDGRVLVTGGGKDKRGFIEAGHIWKFDPNTKKWRMGATCHVPRLYHSVAVLLPDGRVWTGGGNPHPGDEELRIEIYTPGYFRDRDRPKIERAPSRIAYGSPFDLLFRASSPIVETAIVRPSSVTHSFNVDQRWVGLPMQPLGTDGIRAVAPPSPAHAPPGWYLLTLVDEKRRPAIAAWVQLL